MNIEEFIVLEKKSLIITKRINEAIGLEETRPAIMALVNVLAASAIILEIPQKEIIEMIDVYFENGIKQIKKQENKQL